MAKPKAPKRPTLEQLSPAARAKRVAQLAANPATRPAIPLKYLPAKYHQARLTAQRLKQPVTPGSTVTNLDAARQAKAATAVKYGAQDSQLAGLAKDMPGFYDKYLADLKNGVAAQQQIGAQAVGQLQGLQQGITGLSNSSAAQMQQQANQDASSRGTQAGDQTSLASNATAIRQALVAALGSGEVGRSNANNTYAGQQANVVGPGQKLQASVGAIKNLADLKGQEGAYNQSIRDQIRSDEGKNVLAQQALTGKTAADQTQAQLDAARLAETVRSDKASEKDKAAARAASASTPNKYGYTASDWAAMSVAQRQKIIKSFKSSGAAGKPSSGPGSISSSAESALVSQINKVLQALQNPTQSIKDANGNYTTKRMTPKQKLDQLRASNVDPRVLDVARSLFHNNGKGIGQFGLHAAHDLGIHVASHWKVIK